MSKLEVYSHEDAFKLAQMINDLPGKNEIISCYKSGAAHWVWVRKVVEEKVIEQKLKNIKR